MSFEASVDEYIFRVDAALAKTLPGQRVVPQTLHEAMHYATLNGGKRIRPLLVYATGEVMGVDVALLDAPAVAVELIHAFSLVHDDLPAMDDDDLRRGRPTVHRQFDEATAILAADALQPLAFEVLAGGHTPEHAQQRLAMVRILARACGSLGMTGGQAIDIESEGQRISSERLQMMFEQKTGALIEAAVHMAAALATDASREEHLALAGFARNLGLAFQIRDDLLEIEGNTETIGKSAGSDAANDKATWPAVHGAARAREDCERLYEDGITQLTLFGDRAEPLRVLAHRIVWRED
ncbi:MAG: farnesyl diphosphate synthase [Pseudomonadota bacterium]